MASPSSSSSGGNSWPPSPQNWDQYVEWYYQHYVDKNTPMPQTSGDWKWPPYIRSLVEEELKFPQDHWKRIFRERRRGSDYSSDGDGDSDGHPDVDGPGPKPPPNLPPGKAGGSWNYLLYIPAWQNPTFSSDASRPVYGRQPQGYAPLPPRNILQRLRPALRPEDAARKPTPYALRWGIFPGRDDGRSRLSPPYATSRNYNPAINGYLLNTLSDTTRNLLLQQTRARMRAGTTTYRGEGVAPELMDEARRNSNVPGQEDLVETALGSTTPFSRLTIPPELAEEPYRPMIADILGDEDYQRIIFGDWTTDELVRHQVHNMSDIERSSLTHEPLHELVSKEMWDNTAHHGAVREWPRLVYELNGQCKEYDVHKNAVLWEALQPALQLVSKVLRSKPLFWTALKDLRTRVAIPEEYDPRPVQDRNTHRLVRVRLLDEALEDDAARDWPILYQIAEDGLDYESAINYVLEKKLRLEITSGHMDDGKFREQFRYGVTAPVSEAGDRNIKCSLSAEMFWPLLEPNFSSSEKLATSFLVAVVLLHELMHATLCAVDVLCTESSGGWIPNVTPGMAFDLQRWRDANQDMDTAYGEPWFGRDVHAEAGWAFENHLFGMILSTLSGTYHFVGQNIQLPLALAGQKYPSDIFDTETNNTLNMDYFYLCRSDAAQEPLPIYYFAKFFNQEFWDHVVPTFGFDAFKRRGPERTQLYSAQRSHMNQQTLVEVCGRENKEFFLYVISTLKQFGYGLLAFWLKLTLIEAVAHIDVCLRWQYEALTWRRSRDEWRDAVAQMEHCKSHGDALWTAACNPTLDAYHEWASDWDSVDPCPGYEDWIRISEEAVTEHFGTGSPFFTAVARLHGIAQEALGEMEFMVFEFLTLPWPQRLRHYNAATSVPVNAIPQLLRRIDEFRKSLKETAAAMDALSAHLIESYTELCQLWCVRYQAVIEMLDHLAWLVQGHEQRRPEENQRLRETLKSIPSGYWQKRHKTWRDMGMREYQLVAPPIRAAIDEFDRRLRAVQEHQKSAEGQKQQDDLIARHFRDTEEFWQNAPPGERVLSY